MNKQRKVDLLYKKAKNQYLDITKEELKELKKYKVDYDESEYLATKKNISQYVTAVDNGCRQSFYDWCYNNKKADRRMRGSSEEDMERFNNEQNGAAMFFGWITWGLALYWMLGEHANIMVCGVLGALISKTVFKFTRKIAFFSLILLPIIIACIFGGA